MRIKIRDLREDNDFTQQQIADYLKCDRSLYSKYEREVRDVPLDLMVRLAFFYNTSVDYIVGLMNEKTPYVRIK
jgi:transcriptional regulator with XRE-family HTH domain